MDSELLCWLPTPAATLTPRLPLPPLTEPFRLAVLVTGFAQPVGVSTCQDTVLLKSKELDSLKLCDLSFDSLPAAPYHELPDALPDALLDLLFELLFDLSIDALSDASISASKFALLLLW